MYFFVAKLYCRGRRIVSIPHPKNHKNIKYNVVGQTLSSSEKKKKKKITTVGLVTVI